MIIECPNCNKKFNLDEKLIPKNGRTLKCGLVDIFGIICGSLKKKMMNNKKI